MRVFLPGREAGWSPETSRSGALSTILSWLHSRATLGLPRRKSGVSLSGRDQLDRGKGLGQGIKPPRSSRKLLCSQGRSKASHVTPQQPSRAARESIRTGHGRQTCLRGSRPILQIAAGNGGAPTAWNVGYILRQGSIEVANVGQDEREIISAYRARASQLRALANDPSLRAHASMRLAEEYEQRADRLELQLAQRPSASVPRPRSATPAPFARPPVRHAAGARLPHGESSSEAAHAQAPGQRGELQKQR